MEETNTRWIKLVERMGGEEAARAEMARRAATSSRNKGKRGGFASMDKKKLKEITSKGGKNGRRSSGNRTHSSGGETGATV